MNDPSARFTASGNAGRTRGFRLFKIAEIRGRVCPIFTGKRVAKPESLSAASIIGGVTTAWPCLFAISPLVNQHHTRKEVHLEETKSKFALWAYPDTMKKVEKLYKEDNCKSKSEFIEKAILFYCGYLTAGDYREYFPNVIVSTMKGTLESLENRLANLLFKNTVELSMLLHAFAATTNIDAETVESLRGYCVEEVKKIRGTFRLEDAIRFQKE